MATLNDHKLVLLIRFVPSIIVALFATLITVAVINDNHEKARLNSEALYSNIIDHQKQVITNQVEQIFAHVETQQSKTEELLKQQAKSRVSEAHLIATSIYNNNPNKSKLEITKMISDALKPIRFYNNRGYFFIFQMDGINVMHALKPHLEGNSAWGSVDVKGTFILQEHIKLIKQQGGEAFYRWWYQKPGHPVEKEFEKIGYGKAFEPYDWFIGTGEYLADVETDVKGAVLDWVSEYQNNKQEKVFILDVDGTILIHEDPAFIGKNITGISEQIKDPAVGLASINQDGDYVDFNFEKTPGNIASNEGVAFIRPFSPWGWVIGSSFSLEEINHYILTQQQELEQSNQEYLTQLIALSILSTLIMVAVSYIASQLIVRRFDKFQQRISDDFGRLEQTKNQMQYMALHDPLTGLANRSALIDSISQGMEITRSEGECLAVVFLDLDDFKKVNDLYGHAIGDKLLESLSRKFEAVLDEYDSVARFGGDEFIFCLPLLKDRSAAQRKVEIIQSTFKDPFLIDGKLLSANSSIGVSLYPLDSDDPSTLITNADMALYRSKQHKKGSVLFFNEDINRQIKTEYRVEQLLNSALQRREMSVVYQPQICADTQTIVGVEALVRWTNQELGFVGPDVFIPLAENNGLIVDIGRFVFQQACEDIYRISPNGQDALRLSVNVSPKELLVDDFTHSIERTVESVGIDPARLTIEVTESIFIHDMERVVPILEHLQTLGFGISLDDFGTGYSSLSHLNHLTINELKIDKSFVTNMVNNAQSNALVKAILAISNTYQLDVVAEGVETKEQYLMLTSYGCQSIQGYFFAKPMTYDALKEWMLKKEHA